MGRLLVCVVLVAWSRPAYALDLTDFAAGSYADGNGTLLYRYFVPVSYDDATLYPLVLFLHGQGEIGTDNKKQLKCNGSDQNCHMNGIATWISGDNQTTYPMFLVAPQLYADSWEGDAVQAQLLGVLATLEAAYPIDPDRIYITGLSLGGGGTLKTINNNPSLFAGVVAVCGFGNGNGSLSHLPIWVLHAENDGTVNVTSSDNFVSGLRNAGGAPIYSRFATGGHGVWDEAYGMPQVLSWLMRQRRGVPAEGPPTIRITSPSAEPAHGSPSTSLAFGGVTDAESAVTSVSFSNDRGGSGVASGTMSFSATVALQDGINRIAFLAHSAAYQAGLGGETTFNDVVSVTYPGELTVGLIVEPESLELDEDGGVTHVAVRLDRAPTSHVRVQVLNGSPSEVSVTPTFLTFTSTDYATSRTVTVTAIDDAVVGGHEAVVTFHIDPDASDASFADVLDRELTLAIADDDALPLLVWLKLDETEGTTTRNDGSLGGDYTVQNGTFAAAQTDNGLVLNGTSTRIDLASPPELSFVPSEDDFSVSVWFKTSSQGALVSKALAATDGIQYYLFVFQNKLYARVGSGVDHVVDVLVNDDTWHLATLVNRGSLGSATLYLDDGASKLDFAPGAQRASQVPVLVGARHNGSVSSYGYPFAGQIDDVRILRRALSATEVAQLFAGTFVPDTDPNAGEAPVMATSVLAQGNVGIAYDVYLEAIGELPLSFGVVSGAVPPGMQLDASGHYVGVPTTSGTFEFTVAVSNDHGSDETTLSHVIAVVQSEGPSEAEIDAPAREVGGTCAAVALPAWLALLSGVALLRRRRG